MVQDRTSFINMWRAIVALTSVDGIVTDEESEFIGKAVNNKKLFSEEEKNLLIMDLQNPQDPMDFIDKISSPGHIAQIHHLANLLFHVDNFDSSEKKYLKKIFDHIEGRINLMSGARKLQDHNGAYEDERTERLSTVKGVLENFVNKFL